MDGTSIDVLEDIACRLGLEAEQVMVPVDHLLRPEAGALPAILVVRQPSGFTHFVLAWWRHGGLVQVMDPGRGPAVVDVPAAPRRGLRPHPDNPGRRPGAPGRPQSEFLRPLAAASGQLGLGSVAAATLDREARRRSGLALVGDARRGHTPRRVAGPGGRCPKGPRGARADPLVVGGGRDRDDDDFSRYPRAVLVGTSRSGRPGRRADGADPGCRPCPRARAGPASGARDRRSGGAGP